jgi:hypothetical protein
MSLVGTSTRRQTLAACHLLSPDSCQLYDKASAACGLTFGWPVLFEYIHDHVLTVTPTDSRSSTFITSANARAPRSEQPNKRALSIAGVSKTGPSQSVIPSSISTTVSPLPHHFDLLRPFTLSLRLLILDSPLPPLSWRLISPPRIESLLIGRKLLCFPR